MNGAPLLLPLPMSSRTARAGGKFTGNHTNVIPAAAIVCDIAERCPDITRISPGFIKAGLKSVGGKRRIKCTPRPGGFLVSVRDNTSHQEVAIYTTNTQAAITFLKDFSQKEGLLITNP